MESKKKLEISESDSFLETKSSSTEASRYETNIFLLIILDIV